jgi:hypothetical protein
MLICMRTTLNLDDELAAAAKAEASRRGTTVTSLIEDGLRRVLAECRDEPSDRAAAILELGRQIAATLPKHWATADLDDLLYDDRGLPA